MAKHRTPLFLLGILGTSALASYAASSFAISSVASEFRPVSRYNYDIDRPGDADRPSLLNPDKNRDRSDVLRQSPLTAECPAIIDRPEDEQAGQAAEFPMASRADCPEPLPELNTNDSPNYPNGHRTREGSSASGGNTLGGGVAGIAGGGGSGVAGGGGNATTGGMKR